MSDDGPSWQERGLPPELDPRRPSRRARAAGAGRHEAAGANSPQPQRHSQPKPLPQPQPQPQPSLATRQSVAPGPARSGRGRRWLKILSLGTAAFVLLAGIGVYGLYRHLDGNLTRANVFGLLGHRPDRLADGALNVLLVGSDSRAGADAEYQGRGKETVVGARSDTTILAHISADRRHAVLMSIPRDLLLPIPSCTDPATGKTHPAHSLGQFNSAYAEGGPGCTVATVEQLTDVRVDHYVEVDFTGFKAMVNALDGVPICLPTPIHDDKNTVDLPAGPQTLTGDQALGFVRARYGVGDGSDLSRIDRQKQFLGAMVRRATSAGILLRPDRLVSFLDAATSAVKVDQGLSVGDMKTLATSLGGLDPQRVAFVTLPVDPTPGPDYERGGPYYGRVKADAVQADTLFTALRTDSHLPGEQVSAPSGPLTVDPGHVTVAVQNAGGVHGAAGTAAGALRRAGFRTSSVGNAPAGTPDTTAVRYAAGDVEQARTLAAAVGVTAHADPGLRSGVVLLVGTDFPPSLTAVQVSSSAPAPSADASSAAVQVPTTTAADTSCS